jgi:hypothetical protein
MNEHITLGTTLPPGITGITGTTYPGTYGGGLSTPLNNNLEYGIDYYSGGTLLTTSLTTSLITNLNNMVKQVKVAVFTVKRNKENKIISTKFIKELWVEIKNGSSLDLAVAKELDKDFDPTKTIIKELHTVTF